MSRMLHFQMYPSIPKLKFTSFSPLPLTIQPQLPLLPPPMVTSKSTGTQKNLTPSNVSSIKANHSNVKVALSLGGDTIEGKHVHFKPTQIVREYNPKTK